jgi:hypothetical protein
MTKLIVACAAFARSTASSKLMDSRAESPMETRVRLLLVLAGLPSPDLQIELADAAGFVARGDKG